jgi:hypothetical protein
MTNPDQPNVNARLDDIDAQLEQLGDEIDLIRTIQNANRRETRANSQTAARLERTVAQLADIARDHQQALRIAERNFERIQEQANSDRILFQTEIKRIWEYLLQQSGNGNSSRGE